MKAIRKMVFSVVKSGLKISALSDRAPPGFQVSLKEAVSWAAREARLHNQYIKKLEVNLKLDGRPFFGKIIIYYLNKTK